MKTVHVELPDQLAQEIGTLVHRGWFMDESEAVCFALRELVERQRFQLLEDQQREDIAWAKGSRGATD